MAGDGDKVAENPEGSAVDEEEEDMFKADDDEEQEENGQAQAETSQPPGDTADGDGDATATATADESKTDAAEPTSESASLPPGKNEESSEPSTDTPSATFQDTTASGNEEQTEDTPVSLIADAPIPRVSAPAPASKAATTGAGAAKTGGNAGKYGLPADIVIPASITPTLLQGRLLETLRGLPKQLITDALTEYDDAVKVKGESIRNRGAYLYGVVKRYVSVQERATSGEGEGVLPMGPELTPAVNQRLEKLVQDQFCTQEEMNEKVKSKIRMLSEIDALFAIEELSSVDRTQIRNFGSYFMGILNRYMRGERKDVTSGKKTLAEVRQSFQQQQQSPHMQRSDDRRKDDRFQRGRDSDPQYRRARDDSNRRDRSRDRFDNNMGAAGPRRNSHDFQDPYHPRNQQQQQRPPYYGQQIPMGGNQQQQHHPPPPPRPPGMPGGGPPPYQQQPPPLSYGQNPVAAPMQSPYGQQQQQQAPLPHMNQAPPQQYAPPPMGGPPQYGNQYNNMPPRGGGPLMGDRHSQQPPNQQYGQPPPQNIVPQQQNPYGHINGVPGLPPLQGVSSNNSYGVPSNPQQQPPSYMSQQQQHQQQNSYTNSPYSPTPAAAPSRYSQPGGGPPDNRWGNQQGGGIRHNLPQSPAPIAVDILALADRASSVVQALQNQNKFQMPPHMAQQPPPSPYHQQPSASMQQPPPYGQLPMNVPSPYHQPVNPPYGQQQQQQQMPPQQPNQGFGGQKRRRTTASIVELPVNVQYAVQNLQATGQLNGPLDDGMLGMVKDLPETLALQALQKFAALDKQTMRNKTAYLAGLLRRELEKIHKR